MPGLAEREQGSSGEVGTAIVAGLFPCPALVPSQGPPIRSQISPARPSPADGHVHVLGPCLDWTALLTCCGLWSPRAGSEGAQS